MDVGIAQPAVHLLLIGLVVALHPVGPAHRDRKVDPLVRPGREVHVSAVAAAGCSQFLGQFRWHALRRERPSVAAPAQRRLDLGLGIHIGRRVAERAEPGQRVRVARVRQELGLELPALRPQRELGEVQGRAAADQQGVPVGVGDGKLTGPVGPKHQPVRAEAPGPWLSVMDGRRADGDRERGLQVGSIQDCRTGLAARHGDPLFARFARYAARRRAARARWPGATRPIGTSCRGLRSGRVDPVPDPGAPSCGDILDTSPVRTPDGGLTAVQVAERIAAGRTNALEARTSRTVGEIVRANVFTVFNGLLAMLFVIILITGQWQNGLFGGVIVANSAIGIVQELRAKRTLDRLAVLNAPRARAIRDGVLVDLAVADVVLDDLLEVRAGDQVPADGVATEADGLEVDESLLTGESDPIAKAAGAELRSGSIVVAGRGRFQATAVGPEAYAAKLAAEARRFTLTRSELVAGTNTLLRWISLALLVVGPVLLWSQF